MPSKGTVIDMETIINFAPGEEKVFSFEGSIRIVRRSGAEIRIYSARGFYFKLIRNELIIKRLEQNAWLDDGSENEVPLLTIDPAKTLTDRDRQIGFVNASQIVYKPNGTDRGIKLVCESVENRRPGPTPEQIRIVRELNAEAEAARRNTDDLQNRIDEMTREIEQLRSQAGALEADIPRLTRSIDSENERKRALRERYDAFEKEEEQLKRQNARQSSENTVLQASNEKLNNQLREARELYEAELAKQAELNRQLEDYSRDRIRELEERNNELARQIVDARDENNRLTEAYTPLKEELDSISAENELIEKQIDEQPEQLRLLQRSYEELSLRLQQIRNALEDCSEEKQEELRRSIEELQPVAERLTEDHDKLREQREELERNCTQFEKENAAELERVLATMEDACSRLVEPLSRAAERRDNLTVSLEQLKGEFEACSQWLNSVESPLLQMMRIAGLNSAEYDELSRTMNVSECSSVRDDLRTAKECLNRLDDILRSAMRSVQNDNQRTERRARNGEENT